MVHLEITTEGNLLIVSVVGQLTVDDLINVIEEHYSKGIVKNVIWDLRNGMFPPIPFFLQIAVSVKEVTASGSRQEGNTVFIGNSNEDHKFLSLYSVIAGSAKVPIKYYVCRTMLEAIELIESSE